MSLYYQNGRYYDTTVCSSGWHQFTGLPEYCAICGRTREEIKCIGVQRIFQED